MNFLTKTFLTLVIKISSGNKVLEINKRLLNETIVIPTSNIRDMNDVTICGRILHHQFSSKPQKIFQIQTETDIFGLATFPGLDCDELYKGCFIYFFQEKLS